MSKKHLNPYQLVSAPPPDPKKLREWWHQLLREYDRYKCYMVFLAFARDAATFNYLMLNRAEIDQMSGSHCLVIVLSDIGYVSLGCDRKMWNLAVGDHIEKGHSAAIAEMFQLRFDDFPCLLVFKDPRSPGRLKLPLKGLTEDEIAERMRTVLSLINEAVAAGEDPLLAMESDERKQDLSDKYQSITSTARELGGKALEPAMEAFFKALIK